MLLRFTALFSFCDAMAIVFGSALRGAGDTTFPMVFTVISGWFLMVLPVWLVWHNFGGSLILSWWACTVYICALGVGFLIRFLRGGWKSMRVIEPFDEEPAAQAEPRIADAGGALLPAEAEVSPNDTELVSFPQQAS